MSTEESERSGRPKEVHVKWVPRELTIDQKQRRVVDSEQCLKTIKRNKSEFLHRYVTMDETWLHHFTPNSNRQSSEWTAHDEPASRLWKTQQSAGKFMTSAFWDANGIIFICSLKKGRTIQRDYYMALLDRLKDEIAEKRPHLKKKKVLLHQGKRYVFSRSGSQRLFPVLRSQKNACWEKKFCRMKR
ncbi:hypothetical protein GWI33_000181 [Rhynchophorus ferrugineus]|uniref:Transposase n=1 Tax=Rhynchophorus ferrugineus TaxID=354439 RepID=A0A834J0E1_RHYFE|nr:hypothetical protein GWI33_000181 [Rhynchophorus ferrugineus]